MLQEAGAKLSAFQRMRRLSWRRRPDLNRRVEVLQGKVAMQTNRLQSLRS